MGLVDLGQPITPIVFVLRRSEGFSISEIARVIGCSRNTVKAALASDGPPRYERTPAGSRVDVFEPRIRELLKAVPTMRRR